MSKEDLLKVYCVLIRPVFEYAVATYHSMLTREMPNEIERVQKNACRLIFGWDVDYSSLVDNNVIELLSCRRDRIVLNFAIKTEKNDRFKGWFPKREYGDITLCKELKYREDFARTERLRKRTE